MRVDSIVDLLRKAVATTSQVERKRLVQEFQRHVWSGDNTSGDDQIDDILATAAYDLDFYEPRDDWRREDHSYFGDDEFGSRVSDVLERFDELTSS